MSLATSGIGGGGAGGAGMSMAMAAHGGPNAMTTHQHTSSGGAGAGAGPPPGTTAAPVNAAALGADQLDKNQNLNWKQINKVAEMPIVSVDLYGDKGDVSYYPSVTEDNEDYESPEDWIKVKHVEKAGSTLVLKKGDEATYKALRRLLTKSKGYENVFDVSCCPAGGGDKKQESSSADNSVAIPSPQLLLGARQIKQLHKQTAAKYVVGNESNHIIDEDKPEESLTIQNGNLDGSTIEQNNDFDRVTFNLRLLSSKKALTILPEEAVGILVAKAKHVVHNAITTDNDEDDVDYLEYPPAFAIPAWACYDTTIDSLMDACQGTNPVLYQRSVAALAGAFLPGVVVAKDKKQKIKNASIYDLIVKKMSEHAKKTQIAQQQKKPLPNQSYCPMVIMAGMTNDGLELTAIEVKNPNPAFLQNDCHVPFGEFKVISSVAYHHSKPLSLVQKSFTLLTDNVDETCPELEEDGGVAAIVTYGTIEKQLALKTAIVKTLKDIDDEVWKEDIVFQSTREEAVSVGTSVLAAVSHVRIARPAVDIKNVSPVAVGLSYNFHGGSKGSQWTEPKIIFDYDRRVPAGPTKIDFSAAECVALRDNLSLFDDDEKLMSEAQKWSSGKSNGQREEAALNLRVRVLQRMERDGGWRQVGDVMTPLSKLKDHEGEDTESDEKYAIETSTLELSLDSIGFLTANLCSDGQSIEQALQSAKSSTFWKYVRIILAIAFFGGFLAKSFIDERIREHDVKRILAFYKSVAPGTINDGDKGNAYYLCWKYKGKKAKLWRRLETKYGSPVLTLKEYEELEAEAEAARAKEEAEKAEEEVNLDEEEL